jgi:hypothetical protein
MYPASFRSIFHYPSHTFLSLSIGTFPLSFPTTWFLAESSWNVIAHGDAREEKWRGNWRMEWVASTLHTTSELGVSSITTDDVHTSAASSRLNWRPCRFKWTRPFRRKTKSGFCGCAITFQTWSTIWGFHNSDYEHCSLLWRQSAKLHGVMS